VRTTLAGGEYGFVDAAFNVLGLLGVLTEEDETRSWTTEGLVSRGKGQHKVNQLGLEIRTL
jgi:hypothetical protein